MNFSPAVKNLRDAFLLLLWGAFVLWIAATGRLSTYLHPTLQPFTIAAGVFLLILSLFAFRKIFGASGECCHDHEHLHEHAHHEENECCSPCHHEVANCCEADNEHEGHDHGDAPVAAAPLLFKTLLLLLPLLIVLLGEGTRFSVTTVKNRGVVQNINNLPSAKPSTGTPPTEAQAQPEARHQATPSGPMPAQVIDLLYAVQMPSYREDFEGKQIELIGQYVPMTTENPRGDRFQAIRLFITCCAADARPVGVTVQYPKPLHVPEMGWVKIIGIPKFPLEGGRRTAILEASKVDECPAPSEPFVY